MIHKRCRDESWNFYIDSFMLNHLKWNSVSFSCEIIICSGYYQWAINWRKPNAQNSKIDCRCSSFEEMDPTTEDTPSGNVKQRSIKKNSHVWSSWRQMAKLKDLQATSEKFRRIQKISKKKFFIIQNEYLQFNSTNQKLCYCFDVQMSAFLKIRCAQQNTKTGFHSDAHTRGPFTTAMSVLTSV